jgi:hypothetical protein
MFRSGRNEFCSSLASVAWPVCARNNTRFCGSLRQVQLANDWRMLANVLGRHLGDTCFAPLTIQKRDDYLRGVRQKSDRARDRCAATAVRSLPSQMSCTVAVRRCTRVGMVAILDESTMQPELTTCRRSPSRVGRGPVCGRVLPLVAKEAHAAMA